jgi:hypothetical protein
VIGGTYIKPEIFATMPLSYQLLPHPDLDWLLLADGRPAGHDLYAPATWKLFQWSVFDPQIRKRMAKHVGGEQARKEYLDIVEQYFANQLARARRLQRALAAPSPSAVLYSVFGGECDATPQRALLETLPEQQSVRFHPGELEQTLPNVNYYDLMLAPGDGRVTRQSALGRPASRPEQDAVAQAPFSPERSLFVCESHTQLTGNHQIQEALLRLLTRDRVRPECTKP